MEGLFSEILTKEMAILATVAIAVMLFIGKIPLLSGKVNETKFWKDWGVFVLVVVCLCGSFVPGIRPDGEIGNAIAFGFVSALVAHLGRKILAPIFLRRLEGKAAVAKELFNDFDKEKK